MFFNKKVILKTIDLQEAQATFTTCDDRTFTITRKGSVLIKDFYYFGKGMLLDYIMNVKAFIKDDEGNIWPTHIIKNVEISVSPFNVDVEE